MTSAPSFSAFFPLHRGASIFLLLGDALTQGQQPALTGQFLLPIGAFGIAVTLGLYFYELRGMQYCIRLIGAGKNLEEQLEISDWFSTRPKKNVSRLISEIAAAHLIYAAVVAAWTFVAVVFVWSTEKPQNPAILPASLFALVFFGGMLAFAVWLSFWPVGDLWPVGEPDPIAHVLSTMLALAQSRPGAGAVSPEIERLQQRLRKLSQKNVAPSSRDWQTLRDIIAKIK
jgi:hypothetical protein